MNIFLVLNSRLKDFGDFGVNLQVNRVYKEDLPNMNQ
jgi:hypothetical protein